MVEPAISLQQVSKRFRMPTSRRQSFKERVVRGRAADTSFWALRDATFEVPRGSTFGLIGPNGSGKSTALKVMAGIYRPTAGRVVVDGSLSALLELGAGFHPELSGRENITLNASILGLTPAEIDAAAGEIIEFADLGDHIDAPVKVYSSGMYVRLGFAIAVAVRPDILVVDEVIAVGDEQFQRKCFDHLYGLRRSGATVVLVSHGLEIVENMCDEAVWLDAGQVMHQGSGREVVRRYLQSVVEDDVHVEESTGLEHQGSGEARITGLTFSGPDGGIVVSGQPMTATLTFESTCEIEDVTLGLIVVHEPGVRVAMPTTQGTGQVHLRRGRGQARFRTDGLILGPGRYLVSPLITQPGWHMVDTIPDGFELVVQPAGESPHALVQMDGRWDVEQDQISEA